MPKVVLTGSVVQGSTHPIGLTLLCSAEIPDLTGADITIEIYRATGTTESSLSGWVWTTTTPAAVAGDPVIGTLTPPPAGFPVGGVKVGLRAVVTLGGTRTEFQAATLDVAPRNNVLGT